MTVATVNRTSNEHAGSAPGNGQALTPVKQRELQEKQQLGSVRDLLTKAESQLAMALPKGIPASYMIRVVLTVVQRTPELLECAPITLLGAVFQAAQLGLVPDGVLGQAYLVPFRNSRKNRKEVQFIPGYRGLITLVRRSGELSTIDAEVVHQKDQFTYKRGTTPTLEHTPYQGDGDPGGIIGVWAAARLKDGGYQIVYLSMREVERIAKSRSASVKAKRDSPWDSDPEWMCKKTALKQLCKLLPVSTETQRAMALDDRAEIGLPQDLALLADENETPTVDDDGSGDETSPQQVIAAEVNASEAEAFAIHEAFEQLGWKPAQRLVQMKAFKGRAAELLSTLKNMVGPDAAEPTLHVGASATAAAQSTSVPAASTAVGGVAPVTSADIKFDF